MFYIGLSLDKDWSVLSIFYAGSWSSPASAMVWLKNAADSMQRLVEEGNDSH